MGTEGRTLVTGASGFIGGWLVESLRLRGFDSVRAGIRSWSSGARLSRFPIDLVLCDITNKKQISSAVKDVSCVIHCAYGSKEVTVQGTKNVLEAALREGVKRVVHLSTTEVYGSPSGEVSETFPYQSIGTEYGDSKIEAEELCWQYCKGGLPVTVIRPAIVYGPFGREWTVNTARKLRSGNWGIFPGTGDGLCNLIYVADLVSGILLAARSERAIGEAFNIAGPEVVTWNQYFQRFNSAMSLPELKMRDPASLKIRAFAMQFMRSSAKFALNHFEGFLKNMSRKSKYAKNLMKSAERSLTTNPRLTELDLFNRNARYLTTKAKEMLGYQPRFDLSTGLKMTTRWLEQVGLAD